MSGFGLDVQIVQTGNGNKRKEEVKMSNQLSGSNETPESDIAAKALCAPSPIPTSLVDGGEQERGVGPVFVCMSDVEPAEVKWLWPGRIPLGAITVLSGDPGVGKSYLTSDLAARVSRGDTWPDGTSCKDGAGNVLLLVAEDDLDQTVRPRLDLAGADVTKVHAFEAVRRVVNGEREQPSLDRDMEHIREGVRRTGARLVIVDPITEYLGDTNEISTTEVRRTLAPLRALAREQGCAVLLVSHLNKKADQRAIYRTSGSGAFVAQPRAAWLVVSESPNSDARLFLCLKMNLGPMPTGLTLRIEDGKVVWDASPVSLSADELLGASFETTSCEEDAEQWLAELLESGPVPSKDVKAKAREDGFGWRTVERAKDNLGVQAQKRGYGADGKWYWFFPSKTANPGTADVAVFESSEAPTGEPSPTSFAPTFSPVPESLACATS